MTVRTSIFTSLDSRVDADGSWQYPYFDEDLFSVLAEEWDNSNALLIGATSFAGYERLAAEYRESPMVALLQSKPVFVASRSRKDSEVYPDTTLVTDLEPATIRGIEEKHGQLLTLGSARCLVAMLENGSLSALNLIIIPTVVGDGPTLFETAGPGLAFHRTTVRTLASGVVLLDLVVAGHQPDDATDATP